MKKIGAILLILAITIAAYIFGLLRASDTVKAPVADWAGKSQAGQAWQELLISQEAAAARIIEATKDAPQERLEGMDMLSDLLAMSLEMKVDKGNPLQPAFTNWMGDYRKVFGDVGDAIYHTAELEAQSNYIITGNIGKADYIGFQLYGTNPVNGWNRAAANINAHDMSIESNGDFTLTLSQQADTDASNTLLMTKDVHMVMVRQYYFDRTRSEPAHFSIEIEGMTTSRNLAETDSVRAKKIRNAVTLFNGVIDGTFAMKKMIASAPNSSNPPRRYSPDFAGIFYPTIDNDYLGSWFNIALDEALIIEGRVPQFKENASGYWSISLQNRWMQSLDYVSKQTSLNTHDLSVNADGTYHIVIAHSKHITDGTPNNSLAALIGANGNWLETDGHSEGLLAIRYQLAENFTKPDIRVVKIK